MPIVNRVADLHEEITTWRRDLHAHPELQFDVHRTAATVADKLKDFGCDEVVTGIGRTGVVGVIRGRKADKSTGTKVIGLRADMDALPSKRRPARLQIDGAERCMRAGMTGTRRCYWALPNISRRRAISMAPPWSSFSRLKRAEPAASRWSGRADGSLRHRRGLRHAQLSRPAGRTPRSVRAR